MNDSRFPWIILVPALPDLREITDLPSKERHLLLDEISLVSETLQKLTGAQKMNVAALGNMVPQLHIHVIARFEQDEAWPKPVWGVGMAQPYSDEKRRDFSQALQRALGLTLSA